MGLIDSVIGAAGGAGSSIKNFCRNLSELCMPSVCCSCGSSSDSSGLCSDCMIKLASLAVEPYCCRCGSALGENIITGDDGCVRCATPMPRYERIIRLGSYQSPLSDAIVALKFQRQVTPAAHLAKLLAQVIANTPLAYRPDIICPVPLHWRRRLKRGFNQSAMLAGVLARELKIPSGNELVRVRNTPAQLGLNRTRRKQNVRGAFAVKNPDRIKGLSILLVDDVSTTGATADEAARTLLEASAARVILAVAAKAEPPDTKDK